MNISDFLNLFHEGKVGAKSHMKNLIEMAMVDGRYDDREADLLKKLAKKYKVSKEELNNIQDKPDNIVFEIPEKKVPKFSQLHDLVEMMVVDKYVDKREMELCSIFAKKMGYNEMLIDEILAITVENIKNGKSMKNSLKKVGTLID